MIYYVNMLGYCGGETFSLIADVEGKNAADAISKAMGEVDVEGTMERLSVICHLDLEGKEPLCLT